jgi:hypothetical protein
MTPALECSPRSARSLLFLIGVAAFGQSVQPQTPSLFAADAVRRALQEPGERITMTTTPRTSGEMRELVSRCLDRRLLSPLRSISGRGFDFQLSEPGQTALGGVIVLEYPTATVAGKMAAIIGSHGVFHLVVLTRFSAATLDRLLVVTFSEYGDDRIVKALDNLSSDLARASAGGSTWAEPGTAGTKE